MCHVMTTTLRKRKQEKKQSDAKLSAAAIPHCAQPVYTVALFVSPAEEPDEGKPQVRFCEGH
jgi:hypothetical protein